MMPRAQPPPDRDEFMPDRDEFMDPDMKFLWSSMKPLPGDLRLYGGTALAMYLNHRYSTDFHFATPEMVVDIEFIGRLPWLKGATLNGGFGMVDARVQGKSRNVDCTFMECGPMIPMPTREPISAPNGVLVAHPVDIVAAKLYACVARGLTRDYEDVSASISAWPSYAREAARAVVESRSMRMAHLAQTLVRPSLDAGARMDRKHTRRLRMFALELEHEGIGK